MKYDSYNRILTIDGMDFCTEEFISNWVDHHIEDVLSSEIRLSYRTNKLEITITVVCYGYVVAIYRISDGLPDEFIIQSLGYSKALSSV